MHFSSIQQYLCAWIIAENILLYLVISVLCTATVHTHQHAQTRASPRSTFLLQKIPTKVGNKLHRTVQITSDTLIHLCLTVFIYYLPGNLGRVKKCVQQLPQTFLLSTQIQGHKAIRWTHCFKSITKCNKNKKRRRKDIKLFSIHKQKMECNYYATNFLVVILGTLWKNKNKPQTTTSHSWY